MEILTLLKQLARAVLARRKKWILLVTLAAAVVALPVAYVMSQEPPRYRTSATILIESRPESATLFQEFSPFRPLSVQLAILRSRSLAEAVVTALPRSAVEDLVENQYYRNYGLDFQNWLARLRGQEPAVESPQRRALAELQNARVRFNPQRGSGIVEVRAEASRPRAAVDIANTFIEVLLARTRSFNIDDTKTTREYLEHQEGQIAKALTASDEALRRFNLERGGIKVPAKSAETVARLSRLEGSLAEVQANRRISEQRLAGLKAKLEAMPAAPATPKPAAPPPAQPSARMQRLRAKLQALETQLIEFQTRYTEEHPRVTLTRQQIREVQSELGDAVKESSPINTAASTVPSQDRAAFADTVVALETTVVSLGAQEDALREQVTSLRRSLSGLSKDEVEYSRLTSEGDANRRLYTLVSDKLTAARIREQGEMKVVKVIDSPSNPSPAANEKRMKFLGIALMLSLVVGAGVPTLVEYLNRPVESEDDVRRLTGLPVLAVVPLVQSRRAGFVTADVQLEDLKQEDHFLFTEAFRRLRVEIQLLGRETPLRRLLVASALPGEGKSTVVVNLGLAFGEVGKHVIIADADFHRPTLHRTLKMPNTKGFSDLLAGTGSMRESMSPIADGVWLTPRGASPTALSRTGLGSDRLAEVLAQMAAEAEYVLLDSSPILLIPDNLYMAAAADGVVLVVHTGVTRPRDLLRTKEILEKSGTPILGIVLNQMPVRQLKQYYSYYRHYKAYVKAELKG
jgi:capsular exopolysaccharide synthesis family protein